MNAQSKSAVRRWFLPWMLGLLLACNLSAPAGSPAPMNGSTATADLPPPETAQPGNTAAPPTDTPQPTPTFTVIHQATPPGTTGTTRFITDFDTQPYAPQKKAIGGDEYFNNRWERPYTSGEMEYLPDVDLTRVELRIAAPWVYVTFQFSEPRAEGIGETRYGAEFDVNKDGRGDYLIWGASPPSGEWTTDGVEAWQDADHDVGGPTPQGADAPWDQGNGYEKNLVADGIGPDPDLAWIRQIEGGQKVQLAFKYSAVGSAPQFLWNGLADLGVRNPAWFDYNDHFTQSEAGSPLPVQTTLYPLKDLWGIDNTCRDAYGFTPTGTEAGLCAYYGNIQGTVFRDFWGANPPSLNMNGIRDANEPVYTHGQVELGQGACPSAGLKTAAIGASGQYSFPDLRIGAYCVRFVEPLPPHLDFQLTTPNPVNVVLSPGETKTVDFGVYWTAPLI